jgi:REP element-mobilizing transposase RayT
MTTLEPGNYYHVYNRGVNRCNLFYTNENYNHFLRLYEKYIDPIAETYAWALLKNHFHLLVRIREESEINLHRLPVPVKMQTPDAKPQLKKPHLYFSDLFNAYSQAINKQENRTGSLFQRPFRRIPVDNQEYFRRLIVYIHTNPVNHGFTDDYRSYPWSSYGSILSIKPTRLQREKVIGWFSGEGEFILKHTQELNMDIFERYIIE